MSEETKSGLIHISNLTGLSVPLTKLIETVGAGFGRASDGVSRLANAYWLAGKDAKNEAERIQLVERAKTQAVSERARILAALASGQQRELRSLDITGGEVSAQLAGVSPEVVDLRARSRQRAAYENLVQQLNWEAVTGFAAEALAEETTVSQEPVSPDWTTRLRSISQDVSTEGMQALWGNILAGEISHPGSFSLRTLEVLRNLSQHEAMLFKRAANFAIGIEQEWMIGLCRYGHHQMVSAPHGFTYSDVQALIDCGLVSPNDNNIHLSSGPPDPSWARGEQWVDSFQIGNQVLVLRSNPSLESHYQVHAYTKAGNELHRLVANEAQLSIPFLIDFTKSLRETGMRTYYVPAGSAVTDEQLLTEISSSVDTD